jgi:hypothetical protein
MAAAAFNFRGAFLASGLMLFGVWGFAHLALSRIPRQPRRSAAERFRGARSGWPGSCPWWARCTSSSFPVFSRRSCAASRSPSPGNW